MVGMFKEIGNLDDFLFCQQIKMKFYNIENIISGEKQQFKNKNGVCHP